jgi:hypothetical protein
MVNAADMSRGKNVLAIAADGQQAVGSEFLLTDVAEVAPIPADQWEYAEEAEVVPAEGFRHNFAPFLAISLIAAWTMAFVWTKIHYVQAGITLEQGLGWIRDWSIPVALVGIVWLLLMRTSRREAQRFGDVSRRLNDDSKMLEARLASINGELSLAREFVTAQARDLESLGRIAADRLGQSSEELRSLIHTNSAQIESIGSVSEAALVNMEKLRGQLPVIANSARDVTNNMGNAGRTAHAQLQEMINGFKRLNEFGQASERQVATLREMVANTIEELTADTSLMEQIATRRFAAIAEQGSTFRAELEGYENQAIAALESRVQKLAADLELQRTTFDSGAEDGLAALQSRIDKLREEASAVSAEIVKTEDNAMANFTSHIAKFDTEIEARNHRQQQQVEAIAAHGEAFVLQMANLDARMAQMVVHAQTADTNLTNSVQGLTDRLETGRSVLVDANSQIFTLTDASVRLLELIEAGSQHSREKIPAALAEVEAKLAEIEGRIARLQVESTAIVGLGENFNAKLLDSSAVIAAADSQLVALNGQFNMQTNEHRVALDQVRLMLEQIEAKSSELAARTQSELANAINALKETADNAVANMETDTTASIGRIARRLGEEGNSSLNKIVEQRAAEIAGQLEAAVAHAADASRSATIQLRDQLTKVDELAGNLERRVAQARERAEEQVDNDFARRVALITEALNSNAIDIARTLESDVSDIAWNTYLKGDRGIFTRRAVKLIENSEAKAVLQFYESDSDFRSHTNRFIHDFEAMLRQILSTRDGNALGVTLLSSDMGKLYVALAQAIERLRN